MMSVRAIVRRALGLAMLPALIICTGARGGEWFDPHYPVRVELTLEKPEIGRIRIDLPPGELAAELSKASVDSVTPGTLAFERAVLVDPSSGQIVGEFRLMLDDDNLIRDGAFASIGTADSPWTGIEIGAMTAEEADIDGQRIRALFIRPNQVGGQPIRQQINGADAGAAYLLRYWIYNDPRTHSASVAVDGATGSYVRLLQPPKRWTKVLQLCQAERPGLSVGIETNFEGEAAIAEPSFHRAHWQLIGDLPTATDRVDLYYVPRAGREFTVPAEQHLLTDSDAPAAVVVKAMRATAHDLNPSGVKISNGSLTAWTVPTRFPLRADQIARVRPRQSAVAEQVDVRLFDGAAATILLAINTGASRLDLAGVRHDLPADVRMRVEYVAPVPVNDAPHPRGRLIETRLDALMDPGDPLVPPCESGVHVLAITLTSSPEASGRFDGNIELTIATRESKDEILRLPVRLTVLPLTVRPMKHFETSFSGAHIGVIYRASEDDLFTRDSITVAQFHGYDVPAMYETVAFRTTYADRHDPSLAPVRRLAWDYYHRMLDYHLLPETLGLWSAHTYTVGPREEGKAPRLSGWDFTHFDEAIDEFLVKRDVPWFTIYRSNGNFMHRLELADGVTYSFRPAEEKIPWVQLSEEEYFALVADYFDAIACHLDERGFGDRALYVIDECHVDSFDTIRKYHKALQSRPHAKNIRFGHTAFVTDVFTARAEGSDEPIMADVLDVPMPLNDDGWNFFEPEYNEPWRKPGKHQWVYYMKSDHLRLHTAGLNTVLTPLKLDHFGASGWYCWASFIWDMPWKNENLLAVNPWQNSHSWHDSGGLMSFFYPPDPSGPSTEPTNKLVPSYRLSLMRDGIQDVALLKILRRGVDDAGRSIRVNPTALAAAEAELDRLWAENPVQWYVSDYTYRRAGELLLEAVQP